jgi:hypothetical protein
MLHSDPSAQLAYRAVSHGGRVGGDGIERVPVIYLSAMLAHSQANRRGVRLLHLPAAHARVPPQHRDQGAAFCGQPGQPAQCGLYAGVSVCLCLSDRGVSAGLFLLERFSSVCLSIHVFIRLFFNRSLCLSVCLGKLS